MEGVKWIVFAFCVVSCGAHFGYQHNGPQNRRISIVPRNNLQNEYSNFHDHKCSTIARRSFYTTQLLGYPCERRLPGMPVVRTVYGPTGLVCQSYFRFPVIRYYRISTCCPGWTMDRTGSCSIRKSMRAAPPRSPMGMLMMRNMMNEPRRRMAMWHGIQNMMATRDAMQNDRGRQYNNYPNPSQIPPYTPRKRPGFVTLFKNLNRRHFGRQFRPRKIAIIRIQRPENRPPVPHPLVKPPVTSRMIKIVKKNPAYPGLPFSRGQQNQFPMIPSPRPQFPHIPHRRQDSPPLFRRTYSKPRFPSYSKLNKFPIPSRFPQIPAVGKTSTRLSLMKFPQIPTPRYPSMPTPSFPRRPFNRFPQISSPRLPSMMTPTFQRPFIKSTNFPEIPNKSNAPVREAVMSEKPEPSMRIDLPSIPVEQPELVVEKTPVPIQEEEENTPTCLEAMTEVMKNCLANSGVDVPDIMSPFKDPDTAAIQMICSSQEIIGQCMEASVAECEQGPESTAARDMLGKTMETFKDMCTMQEGNVDFPEEGTKAVETPVVSKTSTDLNAGNDAEPSSLLHADSKKKTEQPVVETVKTDQEVNEAEDVHKSVHQAIKHEVEAEEVRMKEFYLPLLIGTAGGFVILVLILSLLICCCCKRRMKKRVKIVKEFEKPGPFKGIYTIGVPPPVYEVNGIPPLYYEEAKGEKISAKDFPAVIEEKDITEDTNVPGESTQM